MAEIKPPPKKASSKAGKQEVVRLKATAKPSPVKTVNLNIGVPNSIKINYKSFCAQQGRTMGDIFQEMFKEYKDKHYTLFS